MPLSDRKLSLTTRLLATALAVGFILLLSELALRLGYDLFPPVNHNLLPPGKTGLHMFEPAVGNAFYRVKPDHNQTFLRHEFRVSVRTNNVGLREDRDFHGEPVDIGFLGDSFTFGWGVETGERYSDMVARAFPSLNVLSYAYPDGHAPVNYLAFLQQNPEMMPTVLVLGLFAYNDLADDTADAVIEYTDGKISSVGSRSLEVDEDGFVVAKGAHPPRFPSLAWWGRHSAIGRTIRVVREMLRSGGGPPPKSDTWRGLDRGELDETARLALDHVKRIDELAREAGSTLLVFYIPFPSYVSDTPVCLYTEPMCAEQRISNRLGAALAEWAAAEGIHLVDPVEDFRALEARGEELYFRLDAHWTPAGHAAAANLIVDYLGKHGLVPGARER